MNERDGVVDGGEAVELGKERKGSGQPRWVGKTLIRGALTAADPAADASPLWCAYD